MVTVEVRGAGVTRGGRRALEDVSFDARAGTVVALIGPNGAGKSTLLGAVAGRVPITAGSLRVDGTVADVPQTTQLDREVRLPVLDVVRMGRYPHLGLLGRFKAADSAAVGRAFDAMDLNGLERRTIDSLSGGQRQRVLVAQGLAQEADVLLLDEPTTAMDGPSRAMLLASVRAEADRGRTVLLATHAMDEVAHADLVLVLAGRLLHAGVPDRVLDHPAVQELFAAAALRPAARVTTS